MKFTTIDTPSRISLEKPSRNWFRHVRSTRRSTRLSGIARCNTMHLSLSRITKSTSPFATEVNYLSPRSATHVRLPRLNRGDTNRSIDMKIHEGVLYDHFAVDFNALYGPPLNRSHSEASKEPVSAMRDLLVPLFLPVHV